MQLIIGGAFQGKKEYAEKTYQNGKAIIWADGNSCSFADIINSDGIFDFHRYIKRIMNKEESIINEKFPNLFSANLSEIEKEAENLVQYIVQNNPRLIVVTNELGYGIVPMERTDRMWRELTGRVCTGIAKHADQVTRVICGIGVQIK